MTTTISFSCHHIDFKDLVMCSFDLNKTEYNLLLFLLSQHDSLSATQIGEMTKKDRTTIQKAIKKLFEKDLVLKHQVNLDTGGYTFVYKVKNRDYIRQTILEIINKWHAQVVESVKKW
ncbi:MAG: HTH domain-containing protein [Nanoarchaeota archaeon]|nr:HTH domain-containing protein [Nanoarchaeota archaeon]